MAHLETKHIFQDPIFHFHDYGRKGSLQTIHFQVLSFREF